MELSFSLSLMNYNQYLLTNKFAGLFVVLRQSPAIAFLAADC